MYNCVHNMYDAEHSVVTSGYIVLFMQQNKDIICGCNCKWIVYIVLYNGLINICLKLVGM